MIEKKFDNNPTYTQETVIVKYRNEKTWTIEVSDTTMMTKLKNAGYKDEGAKDALPYKRYKIPAEAIRFRKADRKKRVLSPERVAKSLDNLRRKRGQKTTNDT